MLKSLKTVVTRVIARLLRVPLFYKVIVANGVIAATLVGLAFVIDRSRASAGAGALVLIGIGAMLMTALVNAFLVRLALLPVDRLQAAATRVTAGDYDVRVPVSPIGDAGLERLTVAFNTMVENFSQLREKQRELTSHFVAGAEQDREQVARRLQEGIAQYMASITLKLARARNTRDERMREALLSELSADVGVALKDVLATVQSLRPAALELLGLPGAVEWYARLVETETGVQVRVASGNLSDTLDPVRALGLYRIIEEAINNAARHSAGDHVAVQLHRENGSVIATIEDDGAGFEAGNPQPANGFGLFAMTERAAYLGGSLELNSSTRGTRVRVNIPVSKDSGHA